MLKINVTSSKKIQRKFNLTVMIEEALKISYENKDESTSKGLSGFKPDLASEGLVRVSTKVT
jgi:hypothetical protein